MNIIEIKERIIQLYNSAEYQALIAHFEHKTLFSILGMERREEAHSNFLAWLLNPNESHGLGFYPLKKFLEASIMVLNKTGQRIHKEKVLPADLEDFIIIGNYSIINSMIKREQQNIDLWIEMELVSNNEENTNKQIRIIIENKVKAHEHNAQTSRYYSYIQSLNDGFENIYIYLTPISNAELEVLIEPECDCKNYIQLNYQYLVDYLIEPCLKKDINEENQTLIEHYLRNLSYPALQSGVKAEDKGAIIMATGEKEKQLLRDFWDANKELLVATLNILKDDSDVSDEDRKNIDEVINVAANTSGVKDKSIFNFDGRSSNNKGEFVFWVVSKYLADHPTTTYSQLLQIFPDTIQGKNGVVRQVDDILPKELESPRRYAPDRAIKTGDNVIVYPCTQWGADQNSKDGIPGSTMYRFIKHTKEKLKYTFSVTGDYPLANYLRLEGFDAK